MKLWKSNGARTSIERTSIENYRDVMLIDGNGKFNSVVFRNFVMHVVANIVLDNQVGSVLHSAAIDVRHLMVRAIMAFAGKRHGSVAILFIDVARAFASMGRRAALPGNIQSEEQRRKWLVGCGFTCSEIDEMMGAVCSLIQWFAVGASEHVVATFESAHRHICFSIEGITKVYKYSVGIVVATTFFALNYIVAMARILDIVDNKLVNEGVVSKFDGIGCSLFFPALPLLVTMILETCSESGGGAAHVDGVVVPD